jgi:glycosyltransferase involved in cell wall biosynthesis
VTYQLSPIKVCFFSHSSDLGGAQRSLLELVTQLSRDHNVECTVVLPAEGPMVERLEHLGIPTLITDCAWWCYSETPEAEQITVALNKSLSALFEVMSQELAVMNPDVIVTNTLAIPWGAVAAAFLGKPHVWYIREYGDQFKFLRPFHQILDIVRESSNLIVTNSNAVRKGLFGENHDPKISTIHNNVELPIGALNCEDGENYFTRRHASKLIITGVVSKAKGQLDAILAVKELIHRKRDVELIIMGTSTPHSSELEKAIKDERLEEHVKFLEYKKNPYPVVNRAEIVLLCSRSESFSRVIIEAMLLKKPVIGTNTGGTTEQIISGYNGLLYEAGDYRQLADKIEYLIDNDQKMKELGENGLAFVQKKFTREGYGGKVYELLLTLKNQRNPLSSNFFDFLAERILALNIVPNTSQHSIEQNAGGVVHLQAPAQIPESGSSNQGSGTLDDL